jgi:hypothetical protein
MLRLTEFRCKNTGGFQEADCVLWMRFLKTLNNATDGFQLACDYYENTFSLIR